MGWTDLMTSSERNPEHTRRVAARDAVVAVVVLLLFSACGTAMTPQASPDATTADAVAPTPSGSTPATAAATSSEAAALVGVYLSKADYAQQATSRAGSKVVYFFHAPWCPTCRATEKAIARDGVPAGLTLVKVDFDSETDLRKTYGVTTQHTFVQIDESGAELAKWTGSIGGVEILAKTV